MDEWHVGDPADWGDSVGVPDIDYMGYLQEEDEEEREVSHSTLPCKSLLDEAWNLRQKGNFDAALSKINESIDCSERWYNLNVKAIILEDMGQYPMAMMFFDKALSKRKSQLVRNNKARLLEKMATKARYSNKYERGLEYINEALKISDDEIDQPYFLRLKAELLEFMGNERKAYVCRLLSKKDYEGVDEFEKQSKIIESTRDTLICITATRFHGDVSLTDGMTVDLVKEPDNEHDEDAIRVEYHSKKAGYVANSHFTLTEGVKSASQIRELFKSNARAEILFTFMDKYMIAKLIR